MYSSVKDFKQYKRYLHRLKQCIVLKEKNVSMNKRHWTYCAISKHWPVFHKTAQKESDQPARFQLSYNRVFSNVGNHNQMIFTLRFIDQNV